MDDSGNVCLKWTEFAEKFPSLFEVLRGHEEFVDVSLCCEGKVLTAHRLILAAYSPCFRKLLKVSPSHHPIIILKDTSYTEMQKLLSYMYSGQVVLPYQELQSFLDTAQSLQIQGLVSEESCLKSRGKDSIPVKNNDGRSKAHKSTPSVNKTHGGKKSHTARHNDKENIDLPVAIVNEINCDAQNKNSENEPKSSDNEDYSMAIMHCVKEEVEDLLEVHMSVGSSPESELCDSAGEKRKASPFSLLTEDGDNETILSDTAQFIDKTIAVDSSGCPLAGTSFPCPFCFRTYTNWGFRRRHLKSMHNLGGPFSCKWCDQFLAQKSDWSDHMIESHQVSQTLLHDSLMMLEEAHMVLQDSRPLKLLKTDSGQFVPSKDDKQ